MSRAASVLNRKAMQNANCKLQNAKSKREEPRAETQRARRKPRQRLWSPQSLRLCARLLDFALCTLHFALCIASSSGEVMDQLHQRQEIGDRQEPDDESDGQRHRRLDEFQQEEEPEPPALLEPLAQRFQRPREIAG